MMYGCYGTAIQHLSQLNANICVRTVMGQFDNYVIKSLVNYDERLLDYLWDNQVDMEIIKN